MASDDLLASKELEAFISKMIELARPAEYYPALLMRMKASQNTCDVISNLVKSSEIQSGFRTLRKIGLVDWTIESAVLKFPSEFDAKTVECAKFRLENADELLKK